MNSNDAAANATAGLRIVRVPLASLQPDPANARAHGERNLDAITASLRKFGQAEPLLIQAGTRRIIAGNGRYTAMKGLAWTECDIVELDVDDLSATSLSVAMNRTSDLSAFDEPALAKLLEELRAEDALEGVGFSTEEIDALLKEIGADATGDVEDPGPGEVPEKPVSREGDLWLLGDHRLICGDSTKRETYERVLGSERAALLASDPPYLISYSGGNHPQSWANDPRTRDKHWDDYVDPEHASGFFREWLSTALAFCVEAVPVYQWHATRRQALVERAWEECGLLVHQTIIWAKARPVLTRCHYMWQHEPAFYGWPKGSMPPKGRRPPNNETTVWQIDQVGQQDGIHPTQKALELFLRPIRFHTLAGEVVLEPFSGSGTQLVAAEQLKRRCRAIEISPAFVDVAIVRWQGASGKQATLDGNGRTFEAISKERAKT